jgi:hypothetical protein
MAVNDLFQNMAIKYHGNKMIPSAWDPEHRVKASVAWRRYGVVRQNRPAVYTSATAESA